VQPMAESPYKPVPLSFERLPSAEQIDRLRMFAVGCRMMVVGLRFGTLWGAFVRSSSSRAGSAVGR
jgi:hypothetical protein